MGSAISGITTPLSLALGLKDKKKAAPIAPVEAAPVAPVIEAPTMDNQAITNASLEELNNMKRRRGRASTILSNTGDDSGNLSGSTMPTRNSLGGGY